MIEPVLKTKESDTVKYNDFAKSNQNNSLETERLAQQNIKKQSENSTTVNEESLVAKNDANNPPEKNNQVGFQNIAERLREATGMTQVYFQFELCDENNKELILKVLDKTTHEVIQQFPSELSLKIAQMLEEQLGRGLIANATV